MDADNSFAGPRPMRQGGSVVPANPGAPIKDRLKAALDPHAVRFELRDPFAEVTYRADTVREIAAKAEQVGSNRFTSIDAQGLRTTIRKVNGQWQAVPQREVGPEAAATANTAHRDLPKRSGAPTIKTLEAPTTATNPSPRNAAQAERAAQVALIEAALAERYVIKRAPMSVGDVTIGRTEYRFHGDTARVAFTESTFRLATDMNSPSVARSMVDVAEARNWRTLRVSGHEDFRRMVWLEASARGVRTIGYEPLPVDLELLRREREARLINRIEPAGADPSVASPASADKPSGKIGAGRKAVLAAIEAVLVSKRVPDAQREAVLAAASDKLAQRLRDGQALKVKVYDKAAPSRRPVPVPGREVQRTREWAAPAR
jgi:hypothetical protein